MLDINSGYVGKSMSLRASWAYNEGLKPLSRFTKKDLINFDIEISLSFAKFLAKKAIWESNEWHHTGDFLNETKFYNLENLKLALNDLTKNELTLLFEEFKSSQNKTKASIKVKGIVTLFEGKHRHYQSKRVYEFKGVKEGNWVIVKKMKRIDLKLPQPWVKANFKKKANNLNIRFDVVK